MDSVLSYLSTTAIGVLALTIITFCALYLFHSSRVGQVREPPMAAGAWPILGHLPLFSGSQPLHITLGAMADKYGPLFTIKFGATKTLVLSNWEMAKECFTTNDMVVSSRPKSIAVENLTYNQAMFGFAPYGPYWRELRKIVASEFLSNYHIDLLGHICVSEAQASIKELFSVWSSGKNEFGYVMVDMKQWFAQLAYNMVLRMVAGKRIFGDLDVANEDKAKRFHKTIRELMRQLMVFTVGDAIPSLRWLDLGGHEKAMKKTLNELDKILSEWLEEHHQKTGLEEKASNDRRDFMDVMLSVLNKKKVDGFDADTINKATALTLIVGGADPPGITLTWAMCLLLRNPHTLEKAKEELDIQIGRERCISESDISKLVYLQAIVKETLRLYSPGPLAALREFTENCTLGGYHVEKGTRLITNIQKIQTDPSIWSDPLEFKPERYLTTHKNVDVLGHHFELLPFGSGRRICPGMSFGLQIVHLTLANFLHSFEILNPSTEPVDMTGSLGLTITKATPLEILVKPRLASTCYKTI